MKWKLKANIQKILSIIPLRFSYEIYYQLQRHFGGLREVNPIRRLSAGIKTWEKIIESGRTPFGKVFLELGTGRVPIIPLAYWLMGAKKIITLDINPYLKKDLIIENIDYILKNKLEIQELFGEFLDEKRLNSLLKINSVSSIDSFLDFCNIDYICLEDTSKTGLTSQSIDFYTSFTVLEHIPVEDLKGIIMEGNRIIKDSGLFVHCIDYSDHFWHSDKNISPINFLQYSDNDWENLAGNKYMYMNRIRHDDFLVILEDLGHKILDEEKCINWDIPNILNEDNFKLDHRFSEKSEDVLSIINSWVISHKIYK